MGIEDAIRRALANEDKEFAASRWSDALSSSGKSPSWFGVRFGSRLVDSRTIQLNVPPETAFRLIQRIGGDTGWYAWNCLWQLRGLLDLFLGGVGMRHGRSNPDTLRLGDIVDFWRVEEFQPDKRLRLAAEMKIPGRAWLEFEVEGNQNSSTIHQTAIFDPVGLSGQVYWYALSPLHHLVFTDMLRGIGDAAQKSYQSLGNGHGK
jgi:hypothetical protein